MSNDRFYPRLDGPSVFNVGVVLRQLAEDPDFLDDPGCPYPKDVKDWFVARVEKASTGTLDDLETEAVALFKELKTIGIGLDGSDKLQWLKASTTLFEKLINLKERAAGVKAVGEFKALVLEVIENVLTAEQRTLIMDRLNASL